MDETEQATVEAEAAEEEATPAAITWAKFLESRPPGTRAPISDLITLKKAGYQGATHWELNPARLRLYCPGEHCDAERFWVTDDSPRLKEKVTSWELLRYHCNDCEVQHKTFAVIVCGMDASGRGDAWKIGEVPEYGAPLPRELRELLGDAFASFERGYRAECSGFGLGSFAYYRHVIY